MEKGKGNKAKQTEGAEEKKLDGTAYPAQGPGATGAINFDIIHEASSAPGERREKRGGQREGWRNSPPVTQPTMLSRGFNFLFSLPRPTMVLRKLSPISPERVPFIHYKG